MSNAISAFRGGVLWLRHDLTHPKARRDTNLAAPALVNHFQTTRGGAKRLYFFAIPIFQSAKFTPRNQDIDRSCSAHNNDSVNRTPSNNGCRFVSQVRDANSNLTTRVHEARMFDRKVPSLASYHSGFWHKRPARCASHRDFFRVRRVVEAWRSF